MKEQLKSAILPKLPIVGTLKLTSRDGTSLCGIEVVTSGKPQLHDEFFLSCYEELLSYLSGKTKKLHIKVDLKSLSPFHQEVLKFMKAVPFGKVSTYKELALKMDSRAYQAIGSACGRNPLMLIYPCHRIVGSHDLGGFAHGLEMKKKLLSLEGLTV